MEAAAVVDAEALLVVAHLGEGPGVAVGRSEAAAAAAAAGVEDAGDATRTKQSAVLFSNEATNETLPAKSICVKSRSSHAVVLSIPFSISF